LERYHFLGIAAGMIKAGGLFIYARLTSKAGKNLPNTGTHGFWETAHSPPLSAHPYFIQHSSNSGKNLDNRCLVKETNPLLISLDLPF